MTKHGELHSGSHKYRCTFEENGIYWGCGKGFHKKGDLNRHLKRDNAAQCRQARSAASNNHGASSGKPADLVNRSRQRTDSVASYLNPKGVAELYTMSVDEASGMNLDGIEEPEMAVGQSAPLPLPLPLPFQPLQRESADIHSETDPVHAFELANFFPTPSLHLESTDMMFAPRVIRPEDEPRSSHPCFSILQSKCYKDPNLTPSRYAENWATPRHMCACNRSRPRKPGKRSVWQGNYWMYTNEVLSERFNWIDDIQPATDALSDDIPVRALLEGWDVVAKRGPLHPSWKILRRIDETLFSICPNTERLAIMRAMHTLLQFHTESTNERYARLPPWYMRRPSQKIAHSYAVDFFMWPGVRERFIFNEHDYCGNEFWHLFSRSMRILWPYEFRDCYTREIETGLYKISPLFDQRLTDIKCWTMGPDIFQRFPELYSDIPAWNHIPQTVSQINLARGVQKPRRLLAPSPALPKTVRTVVSLPDEGDEEEEEVDPSPARCFTPVEIENTHLHSYPQSHVNINATSNAKSQPYSNGIPMPIRVQDLGPLQYSVADFDPGIALDAFAYGAINGSDFAAVYQSEGVDGFPNMTF